MTNPFAYAKKTATVPQLDPTFASVFPQSFFAGNPFAQMNARPGTNHMWMYAAITTIINNYIQCPLRLYDVRDKKKTLIETHPILDLLRRPNPHMSGTNFLEAICWNLLLPTSRTPGGQAFVWGGWGENFHKGQIPEELWVDTDAGCRAIVTEQLILKEWEFTYHQTAPYNYGTMKLDRGQVIRINHFNPYNHLGGVAPGFPLRVSVEQDSKAQMYNSQFLNNFASIRGVFTSKEPLNSKKLQEFKENWDKYYKGAANAGENGVLPYGMDFKELSLTHQDFQFLEQLGWNREAVISVYGLSKFALGLYEDLNYATAKVAKQQLFDNAIKPLDSLIMQELNQGWIEHVGNKQLRICADFSDVAALRDDLDAKYKRAQIAVEMGIPPMFALKMNDISTEDLEGQKLPWLLENASANAAFRETLNGDNPEKKPKKDEKDKVSFGLVRKDMTPEEMRAVADSYIDTVLDPGEEAMLPDIRRYLTSQRNRVLDMVDEWKASGKKLTEVTAADFMPPRMREDILLRAMMLRHYKAQAARADKSAQAMIAGARKKDITATSEPVAVRDWIAARLRFISEVNQTTFDGLEKEVAETLARSVTEELSVLDAAKALKADMESVFEVRLSHAKTIARTETGSVTSYVQWNAMKDAGFTAKRWLTARDEKVRKTHIEAEANGVIPFDNEFGNGLKYPLQTGAPASECVNCRCVLIPVEEE